MNFDFTLDDFQKRSIIRLEQNKNILVCAHTSCGKTLVAEYGIALAKKNKKKVIYTSPIKSLSNQKYSELKKKFKNVGIITGDVKKNINAQCLVLTTEILHKFLYNKDDILNNVGTVIFDEVHYINDNERGHIWEEILIVLSSKISLIMLSATIPNYYEFASWIGNIKKEKVYIELTKKRVVPLQYYIYIDSEHIFKVKNKEGKIDSNEIENAFEYLKNLKRKKKNNNDNNFGNNEIKNNSDNENIIREESFSSNSENEENEVNEDENNNEEETNDTSDNNSNNNKNFISKNNEEDKIKEIIKYLLEKKLYPATLFIFHIQKIQDYSNMVIKNNYLSELPKEEREKINNFFDKIISEIPEEAKNIHQINYIKQLLQFGIGVHHSGLLPVLREIIEILYYHRFIKILFATTSFSIGINMPTKTVVFTCLYKYHESKNEIINSSEFSQMCGRAGRRGIDEVGNIFILYLKSQKANAKEKLKNILECQGNEIKSKFRLSYRIILSFFHQKLKDIQDFFKESFHESSIIKREPENIAQIKELEKKIEKKVKNLYPNYKKMNYKDHNISKMKFYNIGELPIIKLICKINKYDLINKKIYNNKNIIEYLENNYGTILLVKNKSYNTIYKYHKPELVMLINVLILKGKKKLWCLAITSFDGDCISNSNNKENESKKNEKEIKDPKLNNNIGKYKEYKYKYLILNFDDIIEIYEKPKINLAQFYKKDKINNNFDITEEGYFYFKNDKSIHEALKLFYRKIKNNFPKIDNEINLKHKNNLPNKKDIKELDCKKIINNGNENNIDFLEKNILKEEIDKSISLQPSLNKKNINIINDIITLDNQIKSIKKEIIVGEKKEIYIKYNQRLKLLEYLNYIQIENKEDSYNFNNVEEINYYNYSLTPKGKASLEILANDSILITELLFSNIFTKNSKILPVEIIVPFLASFANCEKIKELDIQIELPDDKNNHENIQYLMGRFYEINNNLEEAEKKCKVKESSYNRNFSFKYFHPIYSLMKGEKFSDVCTKYHILEGKLYTIIINTFYIVLEIINFYNKIQIGEIIETFTYIKNNLLKSILKAESLYLKNINIDNI